MRLLIDLQGAQSTGSRNRGIGRYTLGLAEAMLRRAGKHEVWLALNAAFPETIEPLRAALDALLPQDRIFVWSAPGPIREAQPENDWRRRCGEILRDAAFAAVRPDMVHVTSLFEGFNDDVLLPGGTLLSDEATAITVYDLIPLIHPDPYLVNPVVDRWYRRRLTAMRRAGLWLAISESSRREAIEWLNLPPEQVHNISGAADARFRPLRLSAEALASLQRRYGIRRGFVMYTGGIDFRKNLEGLIAAYGMLPAELRNAHQLVIVCAAKPHEAETLRRHARRAGLATDELVITGFVPEDDLIALYSTCTAFCFPSWHEGFGLPLLEAMQCGAAAIAANASSLPEVLGRTDALFDPHDEADMAARLHRVLSDQAWRADLATHAPVQARKFSWDESARRAWSGFEAQWERMRPDAAARPCFAAPRRPRLAYVSPLPPERSGIAAYSAELLPELARFYDIDVVVAQREVSDAWTRANCAIRDAAFLDAYAQRYDRILYHMGNSTFHTHMLALLARHPGTVVQHDFFLSGLFAHLEFVNEQPGIWSEALYRSHGYHAVAERWTAGDSLELIWRYPANRQVLDNAAGVIVHSAYARNLARSFYGDDYTADWAIVPHMRRLPSPGNRAAARRTLGVPDDVFLVCCFGISSITKLNHRLVDAWNQSRLAGDARCLLRFVGETCGGDYGVALERQMQESPAAGRIAITGYAPQEQYTAWLQAADIAVQLRAHSRGETSGTVLDCMAHGLATIVNAHGSMAELPRGALVMLPDDFSVEELAQALDMLHGDPERRRRLGELARAHVRDQLAPRRLAEQYRAAIEGFAVNSRVAQRDRTLRAMVALDPAATNEADWLAALRAMNGNTPRPGARTQLLIDATGLADDRAGTSRTLSLPGLLEALLRNPPAGHRVEPIRVDLDDTRYRYARHFTLQLLRCPPGAMQDAAVEMRAGDVFLGLDAQDRRLSAQLAYYTEVRRRGIRLWFLLHDVPPDSTPPWFVDLLDVADGIACATRPVADALVGWLRIRGRPRMRPLRIGCFAGASDSRAARAEQTANVQGLVSILLGEGEYITWPAGDSADRAEAASRRDMDIQPVEVQAGTVVKLALPVASDDPIVSAYAAGEHPNRYMQDLLGELTQAGDQVLDLGAHIGTFSVPAAALGRRVLAVDASQHHVRLIEASKRLNGLHNLTVVRAAVTREDGPVAFHEAGLFGAIDFGRRHAASEYVPGRRLGSLLAEHGISRVALIKMDIEGSELHALESIAPMLEAEDGPAILYESNAGTFADAGYSVPKMRRWLEARGYRTYRIEGNRWIYAPPEQLQPELWLDVIALNSRQQARFARRIALNWSNAALCDRLLAWGGLPHQNTKKYVLDLLMGEPDLCDRYPELARLSRDLRRTLQEAASATSAEPRADA